MHSKNLAAKRGVKAAIKSCSITSAVADSAPVQAVAAGVGAVVGAVDTTLATVHKVDETLHGEGALGVVTVPVKAALNSLESTDEANS